MATRMRRPVTLAAAVTTAAALGAGALTLALPASAAEGAAPPMPLVDGTLDWGVKQSFRSYLAQPFAKGRITLEGGATQAAGNGVFTFADGTGTYDTAGHATATAFKGGVRFEAHEGALDIRISDVRLRTAGSASPTGEITADVVTKEKDGSFTTRDDVSFAALDMSGVRPGQGAGGAMVFKDIPAALTKDGAAAFAGFYKEGDALDPATLTVKAGARPTTPPPTTPPTMPPTTAPTTTPPTTAPTTVPTTPATTPPTTTAPVPTATAPTTPAPTGTATATPSSSPSVVAGRLTWGVLERWRVYVAERCGGTVTPAAGAVRSGSAYAFQADGAELDADARTLAASFGGRVDFVCAAHGIDWRISGVKVSASGTTGTLTADVTTASGTRKGVRFAELDLAEADWSPKDGVVTLAALPAKLTAAGAALFAAPGGASYYEAGLALDPVTVSLAVDEDATLPADTGTGGTGTGGTGDAGAGDGASGSGGSGTTASGATGAGTIGGGTAGGGGTVGGGSAGGGGVLAATGSSAPTGLLAGAAALVAGAGAAVVVAVRRRAGAEG